MLVAFRAILTEPLTFKQEKSQIRFRLDLKLHSGVTFWHNQHGGINYSLIYKSWIIKPFNKKDTSQCLVYTSRDSSKMLYIFMQRGNTASLLVLDGVGIVFDTIY